MATDSQRPKGLVDASDKIAMLELRVATLDRELSEKRDQFECVRHLLAHDLRAPLRVIDGFAQILQEELSDVIGDIGQSHLNRIHASVAAMSGLLNDALTFIRQLRTSLRTDIDLAEVAEHVRAQMREGLASRAIKWLINGPAYVYADEYLVHELLGCLLHNALKFTAGREDAVAEFGCTADNGERVFFVRDNGVGFEMKYVEKIFQPFQRLHSMSEYPGNGLGLATARRIVEYHGGGIWAESEVGKGTTVYFTLGTQGGAD